MVSVNTTNTPTNPVSRSARRHASFHCLIGWLRHFVVVDPRLTRSSSSWSSASGIAPCPTRQSVRSRAGGTFSIHSASSCRPRWPSLQVRTRPTFSVVTSPACSRTRPRLKWRPQPLLRSVQVRRLCQPLTLLWCKDAVHSEQHECPGCVPLRARCLQLLDPCARPGLVEIGSRDNLPHKSFESIQFAP
jgi:hypothetical protein